MQSPSMARTSHLVLAVGVVWSIAASARAQCVDLPNSPPALTALGCATYMSESGGLYGNGVNARPPAHHAHVYEVASAVQPRAGRVVVASVGMSNASFQWKEFALSFTSRADVRPELELVDGAWGGHPIDCFRSATAPGDPAYCASEPQAPSGNGWDNLDARLSARGLAPADVQVVWLKHGVLGPSGDFPSSVATLEQLLAETLRAARTRYPNLRLVYLSSRTHAYTTLSGNPEPYAYESAFAVRRIILRQMDHDPALNDDPLIGPVVAPTVTWGPYLWAQGTREDGYTWTATHVRADDCTHPSSLGIAAVADELARFFTSDATAVRFVLAPGAVASPDRELPSFSCSGGSPDAGVEPDAGMSGDAGMAVDAGEVGDAAIVEMGVGAPELGVVPSDLGAPPARDASVPPEHREVHGGCTAAVQRGAATNSGPIVFMLLCGCFARARHRRTTRASIHAEVN